MPCPYRQEGDPPAKPVFGLPSPYGPESLRPVVATLDTTLGPITLTLDTAAAPCTVNSFLFLNRQHFFDATPCGRLTTVGIFLLQCGDPTDTGVGGPGYAFDDENLDGATYPAGTVAMAKVGNRGNGSQFFLVYRDTMLPPTYTPFGQVTGGLDIVDRVASGGSFPKGDGEPNFPIALTRVLTAQP